MKLDDVAMKYLGIHNPDPSNFYKGEIQADIVRACSVLEAVLGLTSGAGFNRVIVFVRDILTFYLENE
jgi:hypothetical protein